MRIRDAHLAAPITACCKQFDETEFASYAKCYERPSTIQHWQLRDLISCSEDGRHLYTVCGHSTYSYELATGKSTVVQELRFKVMALAVGHGYIAAAGSESQLDVQRLPLSEGGSGPDASSGSGGGISTGGVSGEPLFSGPVGGSVNNALHFSLSSTGRLHLFVSNNDRSIKVLQLPDMRRVDTIVCPAAVNYCSLNADGSMIAAAGDTSSVYLFSRHPTGFQRTGTYTLGAEPGMCTAWAPSGHVFAACGQDGVVCVWDVRSSKAVVRLQTSQACRNVKFSSSPVDLLAFSEQTGRVQLIDSRCYGSRQRLWTTPDTTFTGHHISGLAFSPSGSQLYAGIEDAGIVRFEINTAARRMSACGEYM